MARDAGVKWVEAVSYVIVPAIAFAECCSWCAVLTTNYMGNAIEESTWLYFSVAVWSSIAAVWAPRAGRGPDA